MSAADEMRASLKELMANTEKGYSGGSSDSRNNTNLCFAFAVGACPAELLYGTKFSLGKCKWKHDGFLKNIIPRRDIGRIELGALRVIENSLERLYRAERKHRKGFYYHANLQLVKEEHDLLLKKRKAHYSGQIDMLLEEARKFGEHEQIDEALKVMEEVQRLQKRLENVMARIKKREENEPRKRSMLKLAVNVCKQCEIAFGLDNTTNRLRSHLDGKLHNSVCILRKTAEDLRAKYSASVPIDYEHGMAMKEMRLGLVSTLREDFDREHDDS